MQIKKGEYYALYSEEIVKILNTRLFTMQGSDGLKSCVATKIIKEASMNPNAQRRKEMVGGTNLTILKDKKISKKIPLLRAKLYE